MVSRALPDHEAEVITAVVAVEAALSESDHTRLPSWLVARIAVDAATSPLEAEFNNRVAAPLRAELERLRSEVRRLSARSGLGLVR
jgi:hypothetical protein